MVDQVAELLAVAGAAPRIRIDDDVPAGRHYLFLGVESPAVVRKRPAVDLQDQRILLRRLEAGGLDDPPLDLSLVE